MKKEKANQLIKEGYQIKVFIAPNRKYDSSKLTCRMYKKVDKIANVERIYDVYYNHIKEHLNKDQIRFIELYNKVKNYTYRDAVEINIKKQTLTETKEDIEVRVMYSAIKKLEYLEQL